MVAVGGFRGVGELQVVRGETQHVAKVESGLIVGSAAAGFPVHNRVPADPEAFCQGLLGIPGPFACRADAGADRREGGEVVLCVHKVTRIRYRIGS